MKEAELRTDILIPLFTAMGFRDVRHYHGGPGEQGKDIVMWWPDPLGDREYHAVAAKAGQITGQAIRSGSAGKVFMQISTVTVGAFWNLVEAFLTVPSLQDETGSSHLSEKFWQFFDLDLLDVTHDAELLLDRGCCVVRGSQRHQSHPLCLVALPMR